MSGLREARSSPSPVFSVVIPFRDEEGNVEPLLDELVATMESIGRSFEVLLIDDGSNDRGPLLVERRAAIDRRLRLIRLPRRQGQSAALAAGFLALRGSTVITLDADLQNDPSDLQTMLALAREFDVVCGIRRERCDGWARATASRIANVVRNRVIGHRVVDSGCSLRVIRADLLRRIPLFASMHRFLPTLLSAAGASLTEVEVRHRPRASGRSKYGIGDRLWRGIVDLVGVSWLLRRGIDFRWNEMTAGAERGGGEDLVDEPSEREIFVGSSAAAPGEALGEPVARECAE